MIFVIDANAVISALLSDSKTRELMIFSGFQFCSPDKLIESINKYKDEFIEKSGLTAEEFEVLLKFILEKIIIVEQDRYQLKMEHANKIIGHIDIEDVDYIALALSAKNDGIWSDDAHFQKQNEIKIYTTEDVVELVRGEGD